MVDNMCLACVVAVLRSLCQGAHAGARVLTGELRVGREMYNRLRGSSAAVAVPGCAPLVARTSGTCAVHPALRPSAVHVPHRPPLTPHLGTAGHVFSLQIPHTSLYLFPRAAHLP